MEGKICKLWTHDEHFSSQPAIVNADLFPGIQPGQLLEVSPAEGGKQRFCFTHLGGKKRYYEKRVTIVYEPPDPKTMSKYAQMQISLSNHMTSIFGLANWSDVLVRPIELDAATADFVLLTFRDQYLGRSDMWRLKLSMQGKAVYIGQRVLFAGCIRAQVRDIYVNGKPATSGLVHEHTRVIFRSESAKFFILLQMSKEMWDFDGDGMLFYEKATQCFLPELFRRWREMSANHVVCIVLFTRVFYDFEGPDFAPCHDVPNRWYKDFYKVIVDWETHHDWKPVLLALKREQIAFKRHVLEYYQKDYTTITGEISSARNGNVLEAINLAQNTFDRHYVDRDLLRTGLGVVVITPSSGYFEVPMKLLRMTAERMFDNGIALDLVCLDQIPLHATPLFMFRSKEKPVGLESDFLHEHRLRPHLHGGRVSGNEHDVPLTSATDSMQHGEAHSEQEEHVYYAWPRWVVISFFGRRKRTRLSMRGGTSEQKAGFIPTCHVPDGQLLNLLPSDIVLSQPPLLVRDPKDQNASNQWFSPEDCDRYDEQVFDTGKRVQLFSTRSSRSSRSRIKETLPQNSQSRFHHEVLLDRRTLTGAEQRPVSYLSQSAPRVGWAELTRPRRTSSPTNYARDELMGHRRTSTDEDIYRSNMDSMEYSEDAVEDEAAFPGSSTVKPIQIRSEWNNTRHKRSRSARHSASPMQSLTGSPYLSRSSDAPIMTGKSSPGRPLSQFIKRPLLNSPRALHNGTRQKGHLRRWEHIYPVVRPLKLKMDWISLCHPACLPIGTDIFPSAAELAEEYQEHVYTVSPNDELVAMSQSSDAVQFTETLLKELIAQRLSQGFQLIDNSSLHNMRRSSSALLSASSTEALSHGFSDSAYNQDYRSNAFSMRRPARDSAMRSNVAGPYSTQFHHQSSQSRHTQDTSSMFSSMPHYLSMGHQIHRLVYDPVNRNVEVKRYVKKLAYSKDPIEYKFSVWPKGRDQFEHKSVKFHYPHAALYQWNYLDHLVAGYQEEMTEALRFWRTRFILIPMENVSYSASNIGHEDDTLNEEELRLTGFSRFLEQFERARWTPPHEGPVDKRLRRQPINSLGIILTTFSTASFLANEARNRLAGMEAPTGRRSSIFITDRLTKKASLADIALAMKDPANGLRMHDRWWHLKRFHNVFLGNELIDWLLRMFSDIETRSEALEFANHLKDLGLIEHCMHRHRVLDGHYFYRLKQEFAPPTNNAQGWLQRAMRILPTDGMPRSLDTQSTQSDSTSSRAPSPVQPRRIELTRRMVIDLDPQRQSGRQETAILHYDVVHNPRSCYHFQLNWLGCTAHLIENLLQTWSRVAEKCGLRLVEAPVEQERPEADDNPFQSPVEITLTVPPPSAQELKSKLPPSVDVPETFFQTQLVKHFGFVLDVDANINPPPDIEVVYSYHHRPYRYTQYVHSSGVAFVQICEPSRGFLWVNNRLYTSHVNHRHAGPGRGMGAAAQPPPDPDQLRRELTLFCQDKARLQAFWTQTSEALLATFGIELFATEVPDNIQAPDILDSREAVLGHAGAS